MARTGRGCGRMGVRYAFAGALQRGAFRCDMTRGATLSPFVRLWLANADEEVNATATSWACVRLGLTFADEVRTRVVVSPTVVRVQP